MSQTAQAVENALKGEKTFQTVQFAITGDAETDMIAGVLAFVNSCITVAHPNPIAAPPASAYWAAHRVLSYLSGRLRAQAELAQGREDSFKQMSQQAQGSWQSVAGTGIPGASGLGGQIYQTSSANVHPQMSQAAVTPLQRRQNEIKIQQVLKEMEEKQP